MNKACEACSMPHPSVENFHSGGLIDEGFLALGVFSRFVQLGSGGDGGVGLIDEMDGQLRMLRLQLLDKTADFLRGFALAPVEMAGQAHHDGLDAALGDEGGDALEGVLFCEMNRFHRVRHDAHGIRGGDADAGDAEVDAESRMGKGVAHFLLEKVGRQQR